MLIGEKPPVSVGEPRCLDIFTYKAAVLQDGFKGLAGHVSDALLQVLAELDHPYAEDINVIAHVNS